MKPLFNCELNYFPAPHLNQIYDGFEKLRKAGIINLSMKRTVNNPTKPLLSVTFDSKYKVIYDTLDGLNWVNGSVEDNLNYFRNNIEADFYFKRSYTKQLLDNCPNNCKIYPLGLNYNFTPKGRFPKSFKETFKDTLTNNLLISKFYKKASFSHEDFEYYPIRNRENKILFTARLWNPDEVSMNHLKVERELINESRINCVKACKSEFGDKFTGGLIIDSFTIKHAKDLIVPFSMTRKDNFLNLIKQHNICIATTGLHDSIGWKFGEYVAASRAIVTEPLQYDLPGNFKNYKNYLSYNSETELINRISYLLNEKDALFEMMRSNYQYYYDYMRPDILVLNTILKIYHNY